MVGDGSSGRIGAGVGSLQRSELGRRELAGRVGRGGQQRQPSGSRPGDLGVAAGAAGGARDEFDQVLVKPEVDPVCMVRCQFPSQRRHRVVLRDAGRPRELAQDQRQYGMRSADGWQLRMLLWVAAADDAKDGVEKALVDLELLQLLVGCVGEQQVGDVRRDDGCTRRQVDDGNDVRVQGQRDGQRQPSERLVERQRHAGGAQQSLSLQALCDVRPCSRCWLLWRRRWPRHGRRRHGRHTAKLFCRIQQKAAKTKRKTQARDEVRSVS